MCLLIFITISLLIGFLFFVFLYFPRVLEHFGVAVINEIERMWIIPMLDNHEKAVAAYKDIFEIQNKRIERLESMFIALGEEELLDHMIAMEQLADENLRKVLPPEMAREKLKLVRKENGDRS